MFFAGLVFSNGADRAGIFAGNNVFDNGRIGADIMAATAFDAEILINESLAVYETDVVFRGVNLAGAGNAGAAEIADNITFFAAGHAGGVDNRDFARLQFFAFEGRSGRLLPSSSAGLKPRTAMQIWRTMSRSFSILQW